jgi:hypothetical protein
VRLYDKCFGCQVHQGALLLLLLPCSGAALQAQPAAAAAADTAATAICSTQTAASCGASAACWLLQSSHQPNGS